MFETAFELAVVISTIDHFTAPARKMAEQMGLLQKQTKEMQQQMAQFKGMALAGGAVTAVGYGLAKGLISAVDSAGRLQTSMMGVKESLGLTNEEMAKMSDMAQTIGIPTIFSSEEVGGIMQAMATAGLSKQQVMDPNILKEYVNFADVQAQIKHENAPDVVSSGINMAHQYQLYSTDQITPFLNSLNAALLHTHATASEFGTTYKYIANQSRTMGMSSDDTLAATAWLDRMGFGSGKGGTNFADFLQRSIYHSSGSKADSAMEQAGFVQNGHSVFENAQGQFVGIPAAVQIMQDFAKRFNNNANVMNPLLHDIFGTQGARVAMMMTSQGASDQYTNVQQQIGQSAGIDQSQDELNKTWQGKLKQMETTLQDIAQAFGKNVMPYLLPVVKVLDDILGRVLEFEQQHPKMMAYIAAFTGIAAAASLIIGPLMILVGALGYLSKAGLVGAGFQILGKSVMGMLGPFALVASAGYLLYKAWQTDFGGIREKTQDTWNWIKKETPIAIAEIKKFATELGFIGKNGSFQMPSWAKWVASLIVADAATKKIQTTFSTLQTAFKSFKSIESIVQPLTNLVKLVPGVQTFIGAFKGFKLIGTLFMDLLKFTKFFGVQFLIGLGPVGWVILGIIAIVTLLWIAWKTDFGHIQEHVHQWVTDIKTHWAKFRTDTVNEFHQLGQDIQNKWESIMTWFDKLPVNLQKIGKNMIDGLKIGIQNGWGELTSVWNQLVDHLPASLAAHLEIHSPSRVMMQMGGYISQGLAQGILDKSHLVNQASNQLAVAATPDLQTPGSYLDSLVNRIGTGGNTTVNIHPGAVQINGAGQQAGDIVDEMFDRLGVQARTANMSRPMGYNRLAFNSGGK